MKMDNISDAWICDNFDRLTFCAPVAIFPYFGRFLLSKGENTLTYLFPNFLQKQYIFRKKIYFIFNTFFGEWIWDPDLLFFWLWLEPKKYLRCLFVQRPSQIFILKYLVNPATDKIKGSPTQILFIWCYILFGFTWCCRHIVNFYF